MTGFCPLVPGALSTRTDAQGSFALGPLAPGSIYLDADGSPEFISPETEPVEAGTSGVTLQLREGMHVTGRVLDAQGAPVPHAAVAEVWGFDHGTSGTPFRGLDCDEEGRFDGALELWQIDSFVLVAYSPDRMLAGLIQLEKGGPTTNLRIEVGPSVRVHGRIVSQTLGRPLAWTNTYWNFGSGKARLAQCMSSKGEFDVRLPAGSYDLFAYGEDVVPKHVELEFSSAAPDRDLGEIDIPAAFLALHKGKELPPWNVTEARGVPIQKSALADFRGKWLLVEFWGYW